MRSDREGRGLPLWLSCHGVQPLPRRTPEALSRTGSQAQGETQPSGPCCSRREAGCQCLPSLWAKAHVLYESWPDPPSAQASVFPSPADPEPLRNRRSGPWALPWDKTQEVALRIGDLSGMTLVDGIPHMLQGTWGLWLQPLPQKNIYLSTWKQPHSISKEKAATLPVLRPAPVQRQAQQLPGATHCPPRGHFCLGGVTPGGKVVEGAAGHGADKPNVHPRESCVLRAVLQTWRGLWMQNVCQGRRLCLRDRTA